MKIKVIEKIKAVLTPELSSGELCNIFREWFLVVRYIFRHPKKFWNALSEKTQKWTLRSLVFLLIILIAVPLSFWLNSNKAEAAWWNDSWIYRKKITVTNSSGGALTNFQVKALTNVDLSTDITNGKVQADLDDLRFTDINGVLLPYWIEDTTTSSVDAWVKMPSIPTTGASVYMYYGNPSVSSAQNGNNVFEFFDDFNSLDGVKWTSQTGSPSVSGGELTLNSSSGLFAGNYIIPESTVWESRSNPQATDRSGGAIRAAQTSTAGWVNDGGTNIVDILWWSNNQIYAEWDNGEASFMSGYSSGYAKYKIIYRPANADSASYYYNDGNVYNRSGNITQSVYPVIYSSNGQSKFDWFFIRQYASTDPSAGAPATEEKGTGPIAYWSFDDGQGITAQDKTSNNNDCTLTNMSSTPLPTSGWQTEDNCIAGKCLAFDGSNDYIETSVTTLSGTGAKTISAWFKTTASATYNVIYGEQFISGGYLGTVIYTNVAGNLVAKLGPDAQGVSSLATPLTYNDGKWHHVSVTWNGTNNANGFVIYMDGVSVATATAVNNAPLSGSLSGTTKIGMLSDATRPFSGKIDEVKVYKYSRSAAQIKLDYTAGIAGNSGAEGASVSMGGKSQKWLTDGLVGHWKMDEASWNGTAGEVNDASGNGNNGTRAGDATTAAGKFGNGGTFDGTGDYINTGATFSSLTTAFSFSFWVNPSATQNGTNDIFGSHGGAYQGIVMQQSGGSTNLYSWGYGNGSAWGFDSGTVQLTASTWQYVTAVKDSQYCRFYVNGVEMSRGSCVDAVSPINTNFMIALGYSDAARVFRGKIDDFRIYNRALSPKEISDLYNYAPGPVGYWKMDEKVSGNSKTLYDNSGNSNNATTYYGANATGMDCTVLGKFDGACNFDGTDDYVDAGIGSSLQVTGTITIEAWIKPNTLSGYHRIVDKFPGSYHGWSLYQSDQSLGFQLYTSALTEYYPGGSPMTTVGNWYHIVATYDGAFMRTYVNGILLGTPQAKTGLIYNDAATNVNVGKNVAGAQYFNGSIDDVKIYNYPRTQKQIVEDMNASHPAGGSPVGSQVGYWKFDEGYGGTANNSGNSGSSLNGTWNGSNSHWSTSGKFGKAGIFTANADYIDAGNNSGAKLTGPFTLSAWVNPNNTGNDIQGLITKDTSYNLWYHNGFSSLHGFSASINGTSSTKTVSFTDDTTGWKYITLSFDGTTLKLYKDGLLQSSGSASNPTDNSYSLRIGMEDYNGGNNSGDYRGFNGYMDEVKIYNYALTDDEIKLDMNQGKSMQLGSVGTASDGTPSNAASRAYCPPGDTTATCAPAGEWNFEENNGTTANDTSGNNYLGTITGAGWVLGKGNVGAGLNFDGSDDKVSVGTMTGKYGAALTVEAWVNHTSASGWDDIVAGSSCNDILFGFQSDVLSFGAQCNNPFAPITYATNINSAWHHVAGAYNGSTAKLYVDGKEVTSGSASGSFTPGALYIGSSGSSEYYTGKIDHVQIYSYARTPAQIAWDYNRGAPVGWWKMDEGQGITANDSSGNNNSGTLTSMDPPNDWVAGKINTALDFDGSNDYIAVSNYMGTASTFTATGWINLNADQTVRTIYSNYTNSGQGWVVGISDSTTNTLKFYLGSAHLYATAPFTNGVWYHYAVTYDNGNPKIYINGKLNNSSADTISFGGTPYGNDIGRLGNGSQYFNGKLDDVRIYNYALTQDQVEQVYSGGAINFK